MYDFSASTRSRWPARLPALVTKNRARFCACKLVTALPRVIASPLKTAASTSLRAVLTLIGWRNPPCSLPGGRIQLPTLGVGPGKSCGYGRRPCHDQPH